MSYFKIQVDIYFLSLIECKRHQLKTNSVVLATILKQLTHRINKHIRYILTIDKFSGFALNIFSTMASILNELTSSNSTCDEKKFHEIVFNFIERIEREITLYDDDGDSNISENDFRHIELQVQAKRVEYVLKQCIEKVRLVFILSHVIEHQIDQFELILTRDDTEHMENFVHKWFKSVLNSANPEFHAELKQCLTIADRIDLKRNIEKVSSISYLSN